MLLLFSQGEYTVLLFMVCLFLPQTIKMKFKIEKESL